MTELTMANALNAAIRSAMTEDDHVLLLGEDIGVNGGVFRVTNGLAAEFGDARVIDTPVAESGILGTAIGLALRGYRPICEIQFDGFVYPAFDQIVAHLAKMRARSAGRIRLPVTVRIPVGGGIGAIEHHSESIEAYFCHTPGLRVVTCSSPVQAFAALRASIACDDPVIFLEPKRLYWDKGEVDTQAPPDEAAINTSEVVRAGDDITIVTYGSTVPLALTAAEVASTEGRSVEVIDLRTLTPLDLEPVLESVRRTGRAVVLHEAPTRVGLGAEIAARIAYECFFSLEHPVERVGAHNIPYPPSRVEREHLPDLDQVLDAIDRTMGGGA